ncbi:MAG TPA: polymer-forming cytoskeletal protein [Spirochaetota bacterium]|nr:polymer-forming cytoskeletal protein [Spirochaetota bacterium]HRZ28809.1 polymer-forming cytoskeletal protein [Spirochaetota bacterium]HSA16153.1 polymer-forming cytoskeletal protein [Spirochaetota bacterium]
MTENIKEILEDENKIGTVIADDIHFRGRLSFKNSLKIKGIFEGKIETDGHLIIGREARVSADIKADLVSISGIVNGKIKTTQRIDLYKKSQTSGDLVTPELCIESGSIFNGTCLMEEKK